MKKIFLHAVICMHLAASLCTPAWSGNKPPEMPPSVLRTVYDAQQAIRQKAFQKASTCIKNFLHNHPEEDHYLLEFTWGNALALSNRYMDAAQHYKKALTLYKGYGPAWQNLGRVYVKMKKYAIAGDCLVKACESGNKKDPECLYNAAACYLMAKMPKKAFPYLKELIRNNTVCWKPEWIEAYLDCCIDLKHDKVSNVIEALINRYGNRPKTWKTLGNFYLQKSDYKNALACFTIYSYFIPPDSKEAVLLGDLSYWSGIPLRACKYYSTALKQKKDPALYRKLANACIKGHMYNRAIIALKKLLRLKPSPKVLSLMGDIYYEEGKFKKACRAYRQSVALGRKRGRIMLMIGLCAIRMKDPDLAKKALSEAAHFSRYRKEATQILKSLSSYKNVLTDRCKGHGTLTQGKGHG